MIFGRVVCHFGGGSKVRWSAMAATKVSVAIREIASSFVSGSRGIVPGEPGRGGGGGGGGRGGDSQLAASCVPREQQRIMSLLYVNRIPSRAANPSLKIALLNPLAVCASTRSLLFPLPIGIF